MVCFDFLNKIICLSILFFPSLLKRAVLVFDLYVIYKGISSYIYVFKMNMHIPKIVIVYTNLQNHPLQKFVGVTYDMGLEMWESFKCWSLAP